METIAIRILQLVMSLSLLIVVHEFGHFLFAKLFKVRVEKFCLFFDPWLTLLKFPKRPREGQTQYCLGWLPLGGYVKIAGMIDESLDREQMARPPQPWEFRTKPAWQRLLIMVGGVVFNFLLAIVIYIMILFTWGETRLVATTPELGLDFSPTALSIGFCNGDKLLEADGKPIADEATSLFVPRRNGYYRNVDLLRTVANARVVKVAKGSSWTRSTSPATAIRSSSTASSQGLPRMPVWPMATTSRHWQAYRRQQCQTSGTRSTASTARPMQVTPSP